MAESFTRTGFAVVCTSGGSDANAVRFTGREFEVNLNFAPLTGRSLKWYIDCIQTQGGKNLKPYQELKLGSLKYKVFKVQAGKNLKPYQGLKRGRSSQKKWIFRPEKT